jgi:hypothetical protein
MWRLGGRCRAAQLRPAGCPAARAAASTLALPHTSTVPLTLQGLTGLVSLVFTGLFATPASVRMVFGEGKTADAFGAFYGGNGKLLACQVSRRAPTRAWCTRRFVPNDALRFGVVRVSAPLYLEATPTHPPTHPPTHSPTHVLARCPPALAPQVIEALAIIALSIVLFVPLYMALRHFDLLRIPVEQEIAGLDASR